MPYCEFLTDVHLLSFQKKKVRGEAKKDQDKHGQNNSPREPQSNATHRGETTPRQSKAELLQDHDVPDLTESLTKTLVNGGAQQDSSANESESSDSLQEIDQADLAAILPDVNSSSSSEQGSFSFPAPVEEHEHDEHEHDTHTDSYKDVEDMIEQQMMQGTMEENVDLAVMDDMKLDDSIESNNQSEDCPSGSQSTHKGGNSDSHTKSEHREKSGDGVKSSAATDSKKDDKNHQSSEKLKRGRGRVRKQTDKHPSSKVNPSSNKSEPKAEQQQQKVAEPPSQKVEPCRTEGQMGPPEPLLKLDTVSNVSPDSGIQSITGSPVNRDSPSPGQHSHHGCSPHSRETSPGGHSLREEEPVKSPEERTQLPETESLPTPEESVELATAPASTSIETTSTSAKGSKSVKRADKTIEKTGANQKSDQQKLKRPRGRPRTKPRVISETVTTTTSVGDCTWTVNYSDLNQVTSSAVTHTNRKLTPSVTSETVSVTTTVLDNADTPTKRRPGRPKGSGKKRSKNLTHKLSAQLRDSASKSRLHSFRQNDSGIESPRHSKKEFVPQSLKKSGLNKVKKLKKIVNRTKAAGKMRMLTKKPSKSQPVENTDSNPAQEISSANDSQSPVVGGGSPVVPFVKRKPGRPRKNPLPPHLTPELPHLPPPSDHNGNSPDTPLPVLSKEGSIPTRGGPRKRLRSQSVEDDAELDSLIQSVQLSIDSQFEGHENDDSFTDFSMTESASEARPSSESEVRKIKAKQSVSDSKNTPPKPPKPKVKKPKLHVMMRRPKKRGRKKKRLAALAAAAAAAAAAASTVSDAPVAESSPRADTDNESAPVLPVQQKISVTPVFAESNYLAALPSTSTRKQSTADSITSEPSQSDSERERTILRPSEMGRSPTSLPVAGGHFFQHASQKHKKKPKLKIFKTKHRNIVDPVFIADLESLTIDMESLYISETGYRIQFMPGEIPMPSIFRLNKNILKRKRKKELQLQKLKSLEALKQAAQLMETGGLVQMPEERKKKRGRKKKVVVAPAVESTGSPTSLPLLTTPPRSNEQNEQCLPLKKRHKLLSAAAQASSSVSSVVSSPVQGTISRNLMPPTTAVEKKRGPGRPRKRPLPDSQVQLPFSTGEFAHFIHQSRI